MLEPAIGAAFEELRAFAGTNGSGGLDGGLIDRGNVIAVDLLGGDVEGTHALADIGALWLTNRQRAFGGIEIVLGDQEHR